MQRKSKKVWWVMALLCTACAGTQEKDDTLGLSPQEIYQSAKEAGEDGTWDKAVKYLERLEARYPYGIYAQQAQLELGYAHWKDNEPEQALAACERFLKLHPNHPAVDYVLYLKGLIHFNEDLGYVAYLGSPDPTERDPLAAKSSYAAFEELVTRFPQSQYAEDAQKRLTYLRNAMAMQEVHVARYYVKRKAFLAAANRAQNVVEKFSNAPAAEEALYIMVMSYRALGLKDLEKDALSVMQHNFPKSAFYEKGINVQNKAWWKLW